MTTSRDGDQPFRGTATTLWRGRDGPRWVPGTGVRLGLRAAPLGGTLDHNGQHPVHPPPTPPNPARLGYLHGCILACMRGATQTRRMSLRCLGPVGSRRPFLWVIASGAGSGLLPSLVSPTVNFARSRYSPIFVCRAKYRSNARLIAACVSASIAAINSGVPSISRMIGAISSRTETVSLTTSDTFMVMV
jgi:hypothetical protein